MRPMKPVAKLFVTLLVFALIVVPIYFIATSGLGKKIVAKIAPAGQQASSTMTDEAKAAKKSGTPVVRVGLNVWGGNAPGIYYNGGLAATTKSRFYTDEGILVEIKVIDDLDAIRSAFKSGDIDVMGLTTVDSLPTEAVAMKDIDGVAFMLIDWSFGGDLIWGKSGYNSICDAVGKKVAFAGGSPSESLLLIGLQACGKSYSDIIPVITKSAPDAKAQAVAGAVEFFVGWKPDDADAIAANPGSKVIFDTKVASKAIPDVLMVKKAWADKNPTLVKAIRKGWFKAVAEINNSDDARAAAAKSIMSAFNVDENLAMAMITNAKLTSYGDNLTFFGVSGVGMRGEEVYNKMHRMYASIDLAPASVPAWRNLSYSAGLSDLALTGKGFGAEGAVAFAAPTKADVTAPAVASKAIGGDTINFAAGSAVLTDDTKIAIDTYVANTAKEFANARMRIEGHTSSEGGDGINKPLSKRRADAVASYLVQKYNFNRNKFIIVGYGSSKPVGDNKTPEGRKANRRTEFAVVAVAE
jgi:NitT/TauT family transport system substrate-binding protein